MKLSIQCTFFIATVFFNASALADAGHGQGSKIGQPGKASAADRTVRVTLSEMAFEPERLQVEAGETVRFVVTNKGQLLHEFNLGTAAMHAEHRDMMAMMVEHGMLTPTGMNQSMMTMDHSNMPGMHHNQDMKHDDPNSILVEPGQTAEIIWTFPQSGTLDLACNMPGHSEAGMVGQVIIGN